jgi:hypothetical protein
MTIFFPNLNNSVQFDHQLTVGNFVRTKKLVPTSVPVLPLRLNKLIQGGFHPSVNADSIFEDLVELMILSVNEQADTVLEVPVIYPPIKHLEAPGILAY